MATPAKSSNGSAGNLPEGWKDWPGINEAAKELQVGHHIVTSLSRDGTIGSCLDPTGRRRYNPADLASVKGSELLNEKPLTSGLSHDEFKAGTDLVKQVHGHFERMMPLIVGGFQNVQNAYENRISSLEEENARLVARIAHLEKERDESSRAREEALNDEHARAMTFRHLEASENRKDRAMSVISEKLAPLVMQKFGLGDPKMQVGIEFLKTVKREQLLTMLAIPSAFTGITGRQRELVIALVSPLTPEEAEGVKTGEAAPENPSPPTSGAEVTEGKTS